MKVVFISNFLNHHQLPIAQLLYKALGDDYRFIALEALPEERQEMGYNDMNHKYPFVVCAYDSLEQKTYANKISMECDVLLAGSCPDFYIKERIKCGKIVIKISERYFKQQKSFCDTIRNFFTAKKHLCPYQNKSLYFLCASAYTAVDVNKYANFKNRTYKWGYFPEIKHYDNIVNLVNKKYENSILWAGRMIDWKHPEIPILVAKRLKKEGFYFELNLIGTGEMEQMLQQMIVDNALQDCVHMLGSMKPEEVRKHMENSQVYMFTSDRNEGWGAVLNEAMNSGCAVVANQAIGAVPYLLNHEENGLIYSDGSFEELYYDVKTLLNNPLLQKRYGMNAYNTMKQMWNADVAAERLLNLIELLKEEGKCELYKNGPCSRA